MGREAEMNKALSWMAGAMCTLALTGSAARAENPTCTTADSYCVSTNDGKAGNGNPLVDITKTLPAQGIFAVGPTNSTDPTKLYLFYDLDDTNSAPLQGYLGISAQDMNKSLLGLAGAAVGNFNRDGGNSPLLGLLVGGPPTPAGEPTFPQPPSLADLSAPLLTTITGTQWVSPTTQDATPTTLSNALPQILVLPTMR
jgi:hypothetical protein